MTLTVGYASTSTDVYTLSGTNPVTVTKIAGDSHIEWNNTAKTLDIAAGLPVGEYEVRLRATNASSSFHTFVFVLTVEPKYYYLDIPASFVGGSVQAVTKTPYLAEEGETVTLIITPDAEYELESIAVYDYHNNRVIIPLSGSGLTRTFVMPAHHVTIAATFRNTSYQAAWNAALALIEAATFTLTQVETANADLARYRLAELINALIAPTGFVISPYDVVIFVFTPATAGTEDRHAGVAGRFEFRVTPPNTSQSAYSSGVITPTVYIVGNEVVSGVAPLQAWTVNGTLHVSGLTVGKLWYVYNLSGVLIYQSAAVESEAKIPLPDRGVYVVRSGDGTVKVVY
jgi:hypothetical protein